MVIFVLFRETYDCNLHTEMTKTTKISHKFTEGPAMLQYVSSMVQVYLKPSLQEAGMDCALLYTETGWLCPKTMLPQTQAALRSWMGK